MHPGLAELERSWLFVPGDRPDMFVKAVNSGSDAVVLDLEDAVLPCNKGFARKAVLDFVDRAPRASLWVRASGQIPHTGSPELKLFRHEGLRGLMLPKVETVKQVLRVRELARSSARLVVLIESARGLAEASAISQTDGVSRVCFGSVDFLSDVGATSYELVQHSLMHLVLVARDTGIPPPIAGVTVSVNDIEELEQETKDALSLGCFGKLCIHPAQVPIVNALHRPSEERVEWAKSVLNLSQSKGAFVYQGRMIDAPVVREAESILRSAARRL